MQPISNFYCKPANEAEAREIVARAVAHGAKLADHVGTGGNDAWRWDCSQYWGVCDGETEITSLPFSIARGVFEHLTLDQLRKRAPFVGELTEDQEVVARTLSEWPDKPTRGFTVGNYQGRDAPYDYVRAEDYDMEEVTKTEWQAARRALNFAGMLDGERPESVSEKTEKKPLSYALAEDKMIRAFLEFGVSKQTAEKIAELRWLRDSSGHATNDKDLELLLMQAKKEVANHHKQASEYKDVIDRLEAAGHKIGYTLVEDVTDYGGESVSDKETAPFNHNPLKPEGINAEKSFGSGMKEMQGLIKEWESETVLPCSSIQEQPSRGSGLKFDGGKPQMRLLPPFAMLEMAKVMTFGAEKYAADSWRDVENGKERYLDALGRHYNAWCRGELVDEETGLSHMAHIMCNAAFLLELEAIK